MRQSTKILIKKVKLICEKALAQFKLDWVTFEVVDLDDGTSNCLIVVTPSPLIYGWKERISDMPDDLLEMKIYFFCWAGLYLG